MSAFPPRTLPDLKGVSAKEIGWALGPTSPFDGVVLVTNAPFSGATPKTLGSLRSALEAAVAADASLFGKSPVVTCFPAPGVPGGRLVVSTTGSLSHYTEDVRRYAEAGAAGMHRICKAGSRKPILLVAAPPREAAFRKGAVVALLGALGALWRPLEARVARPAEDAPKLVGFAALAGADPLEACALASRLESARSLARDITGTEPEQMTPRRLAAYCEEVFSETPVEVRVLDDPKKIRREYPLIAAVARASLQVARHEPRVVRLEYTGSGKVVRSLWFAAKGVTYDTGGADLKVNGHMAGMSRDKGGAGALAGLFHLLATRRPKGVRVVGLIGAVRNSIGANAYVTDEIIHSRAGVRVRIGNTDAEGRLVLADLLAALREEALEATAPALFSIATLTGHAYRAVGPYTLLMSNGPARRTRLAAAIQAAGEEWGDPCEVSTIRREDYAFVEARSEAEDVVSCNNEPSSMTARGHQFPFAFLDIASGIRETTLPYVHIDIGGSAVTKGDWQFGTPTGAPLLALAEALLR
jgi:leucyl aminopeptidase